MDFKYVLPLFLLQFTFNMFIYFALIIIIFINWLKIYSQNLTIDSHELVRAGSRTILLNHGRVEMLRNYIGQLADTEGTKQRMIISYTISP